MQAREELRKRAHLGARASYQLFHQTRPSRRARASRRREGRAPSPGPPRSRRSAIHTAEYYRKIASPPAGGPYGGGGGALRDGLLPKPSHRSATHGPVGGRAASKVQHGPGRVDGQARREYLRAAPPEGHERRGTAARGRPRGEGQGQTDWAVGTVVANEKTGVLRDPGFLCLGAPLVRVLCIAR